MLISYQFSTGKPDVEVSRIQVQTPQQPLSVSRDRAHCKGWKWECSRDTLLQHCRNCSHQKSPLWMEIKPQSPAKKTQTKPENIEKNPPHNTKQTKNPSKIPKQPNTGGWGQHSLLDSAQAEGWPRCWGSLTAICYRGNSITSVHSPFYCTLLLTHTADSIYCSHPWGYSRGSTQNLKGGLIILPEVPF